MSKYNSPNESAPTNFGRILTTRQRQNIPGWSKQLKPVGLFLFGSIREENMFGSLSFEHQKSCGKLFQVYNINSHNRKMGKLKKGHTFFTRHASLLFFSLVSQFCGAVSMDTPHDHTNGHNTGVHICPNGHFQPFSYYVSLYYKPKKVKHIDF